MTDAEIQRPAYEDQLRELDNIPRIAKQALLQAKGQGQLIDALGTIRSAEVGLASERKLAASEVEPGDHGVRYSMEQQGRWDKTYNTSALLAVFMDVFGQAPLTTLRWLIDEDVIDLKWKWQQLERLVKQHRVDITVVNHEIEEGDDAHVGRVWKDGYPKYVPREVADE